MKRLDPDLRVLVTLCDGWYPGNHCTARTTVDTGWYRTRDGRDWCPTCAQSHTNHENYFGVPR